MSDNAMKMALVFAKEAESQAKKYTDAAIANLSGTTPTDGTGTIICNWNTLRDDSNVWAGRNGYVPLGSLASAHDNTTFCGVLSLWFEMLITKHPNSRIVYINLPYSANEDSNVNALSLHPDDYRTTARSVCKTNTALDALSCEIC